ncbi:polysaccharide deacetylase family protein [Naumannella huperziae]
MRHSWRWVVAGGLSVLGFVGCGSPPGAPTQASDPPAATGPSAGSPSGSSAGSSSPAPTPSPTPSADPTKLKPGANHNNAASAYVYSAKDVNRWLVEGEKAAGYPRNKIAFLTFDDGPTNSSTPRVLDILKKEKVPATFFYIAGPKALGKADKSLVRRTIAEGHAIDIHSYSHDYSELYPGGRGNAKQVVADNEKALAAIRKVLGPDYAVHGYRYPGGHQSWKGLDEADAAMAKKDRYWIEWNALDGDGDAEAPASSEAAAELVSSTLAESGNPGVAVVLLHDYKDNDLTIGALPTIIEDLRSDGYEFGVID